MSLGFRENCSLCGESDDFRRPVPGFPDYVVSRAGEVHHARTGRPARRGTRSDSGYARVWLGNKCVRLHRVVALAFLGPAPSPRHHVAHKDGCKDNNAEENLAWKLPVENEADKRAHGTSPRGGSNRVPSPQVVGRILAALGRGDSFSSVGARFGVHRSTVSRYARGLRRKEMSQ